MVNALLKFHSTEALAEYLENEAARLHTKDEWLQLGIRAVLLSEARAYENAATLIRNLPDTTAALRQCQSALAMMIAPDSSKSTSVVHAFAAAVEAERAARMALGETEPRNEAITASTAAGAVNLLDATHATGARQ